MGNIDSSNNIYITKVIGPGPNADHNYSSFIPDYDWQENEIAIIYEQSRRCEFYLGDWHSHPSGGTALSQRDRKTLINIAKYREARIKNPIMAILGHKSEWSFEVWRYIEKPVFLNRFIPIKKIESLNVNIID